jgi:zinc protease
MSFDTDPKLREKLVGLIRSEIDSIIKNGPKESDLQKVKENMLKNYKENQRENHWWLNLMVSLYRDGETIFDDYEKSIESITSESVRTTLKEIMDARNEISVSMIPAK